MVHKRSFEERGKCISGWTHQWSGLWRSFFKKAALPRGGGTERMFVASDYCCLRDKICLLGLLGVLNIHNIYKIWINGMLHMIWPVARCSDKLNSLKGWRGVWRCWWPTSGALEGPVFCWSLSLISRWDTYDNQMDGSKPMITIFGGKA